MPIIKAILPTLKAIRKIVSLFQPQISPAEATRSILWQARGQTFILEVF